MEVIHTDCYQKRHKISSWRLTDSDATLHLMGHSDIQITLNVYTHIGFDHAKEELNKMPNIEKELKSTTRRNGRKVANL